MEFLLCQIGKEFFALDAMQVQKITDRLPVSRLPYVASYVDGMINVDGEVIAQLNLSRLLNIKAQGEGELVVINVSGYLMALVVDKALEKVEADQDSLNHFAGSYDEGSAAEIDYIGSELTINKRSYLVLTLEKLAGLVRPQQVEDGEKSFLTRNREKTASRAEIVHSCLTFGISGETFALPLLDVKEIIEMSEFTRIPAAPGNIVGIASLRDQPLLVISAASFYDLQAKPAVPDIAQVLIVPYKNSVIGLLVDNMHGIQNFSEAQLKTEESADSLVAAYVISREQKVILLMNLAAMFASEVFRAVDHFLPKVKVQASGKDITTIKLLKVVLANEVCAIPVEHVVRLSEYRNSTTIDNNDKGIVGTVDIDGQIIPLLNINKHMNIRNDESFAKLVIIEHRKKQWALCINEAQLLFDLDVELIDRSSQREAVQGIASHQGELISILDFNWLLPATA